VDQVWATDYHLYRLRKGFLYLVAGLWICFPGMYSVGNSRAA